MSSTLPDREEITALLSEQWNAMAALVADLDEQRWRTPSPLPGWDVFDNVAHIVAIESFLLGETMPPRDPGREKIDVRELDHVHNEIGVINEIWLERLRPRTGPELLALFGQVTDRRRAALEAMDDDAWAVPTASPVGEVGYGRFMRTRLFDCWFHTLDIADALGVRVEEGGAAAEQSFAEFTPALPRVFAKNGGAPQGSRITVVLTGALPRTLHVAVDGRAAYVDGFDDPATVTLTLDSGLMFRLGGGRVRADDHLDAIAVAGDEELGLRLVRNLAFMF